MKEHHRQSLEKLINILEKDERFLAVILSGSLAKGTESENSDIDVYLVVTDEDFQERMKRNNTSYSNSEVCDYPGGYIDGKIIDMNFLHAAAEKGSEPTRASFEGASVVWSRVEGLEELISRITVIDETEREKKMDSFYAQVRLWSEYFYEEGLKKNNSYLIHRSVLETVFYASRYILEKNHMLFPCHKDMMAKIKQAENKPQKYVSLALALIEAPDEDKMERFCYAFNEWAGPRMRFSKALSLFVRDSEWNWLDSPPPLSDC